jgi:16S rRNA (cytosine1402-N4)-methyltransferase
MKAPHRPVLLEPVLDAFASVNPGWIVDCTIGYAGHSQALLDRIERIGIAGIDRDPTALDFSRKRLAPYGERVRLYRGDFATMITRIDAEPLSGILADFGVSSLQLDRLERGFGFESDVLDMRMDTDAPLTAETVVNTYTFDRLKYLFATYGEIRPAARLAQAILDTRDRAPIRSAKELSTLAERVLGPRRGKIHPATLVFQAIRIEVNDELGQIERLLDALETLRPSGAIVGLITFHSLEDRLVKHRFKTWARSCICDPQAPRCTCGNNHQLGTILSRKPITADPAELRANPRSRSAKLRTFRFKEL